MTDQSLKITTLRKPLPVERNNETLSALFFVQLGCNYTYDIFYSGSLNLTEAYDKLLNEFIDGLNEWVNTDKISPNTLWGECEPEICRTTNGGGNPDITGIGLCIAYALLNGFAFFGCLLLHYFLRKYGPEGISRHTHPKINALRESLALFTDTALYFTLAIVIATGIQHIPRYRDRFHPSVYDKEQALMVSTVCVSPCIFAVWTMQCAGQRVGRWMTLLMLCAILNFVAILSPTIVELNDLRYNRVNFGFGSQELNRISNGTPDLGVDIQGVCFSVKGRFKNWVLNWGGLFTFLCQWFDVGLTTLLSLSVVLHAFRRCRQPTVSAIKRTVLRKVPPPTLSEGNPTDKVTKLVGRSMEAGEHHPMVFALLEWFAFFLLPLIATLCSAGVIFTLRLVLNKKWGGDEEKEWGFGQIVGVLMFVGVLSEFLYQWLRHRNKSNIVFHDGPAGNGFDTESDSPPEPKPELVIGVVKPITIPRKPVPPKMIEVV